jgi:hypothetical protein
VLLAPGQVLLVGDHVTGASALLLFPLVAVLAELVGEDAYGSRSITVSGVAVLGAIAAARPAGRAAVSSPSRLSQ